MKYLFQIFLLLTSFSAVAQKQFVLDADAEVREISGSFTSIKVSNAVHLYLSKGDVEAVAISASQEKYKLAIKTQVENGELNIFYDGPKVWNTSHQKINVYVSYKSLNQITAYSASNVLIAGMMELPLLNLKVSGASVFKGTLNIGELNIKCTGASDTKLSGKVKDLNIECSGASDVKAYDLIAENCIAKVSGASDVQITATKEITANASGASDVRYKGDAVVKEKNSTGASSITKKD